MKNNGKRIAKYLCFLLLVFTFNMNVDAIEIYYTNGNGIRYAAPDNFEKKNEYPNKVHAEDKEIFQTRSIVESTPAKLYYKCSNVETGDGKIKVQETPCEDNANTEDSTYIYEKDSFYSCALSSSDSQIGNTVNEGTMCNKYSEWTTTEKCDTNNEETCRSTKVSFYFWYKEVENGTLIDFGNNKNLYNAIKNKIGKSQIESAEVNFLSDGNTEFKMAVGDISKITNLSLGDSEISDIKELKYFTGLTKLYLVDNNIIDISSLSNLTNLTYLDLGYNNITDISSLSNLTNLTYLSLGNNNVKDISSLKGLVNLNILYLHANKIEKIEPIIGLKKLEKLRVYYNKLIDTKLIKKIENYDTMNKYYYFNELKKSGMLKNWSEFVEEITGLASHYDWTIKYTQDSLSFVSEGKEYLKFKKDNNLLKYTSKTFDDEFGYVLFALISLDYDVEDITNIKKKCESSSSYSLTSTLSEVPENKRMTKENIEYINCYMSKFGDYSKLTATYDDNGYAKTIDYSFDLRYFFGDNATNVKTGVSNVLVLVGITLMCSAIGFIVLYKHKTGIQL